MQIRRPGRGPAQKVFYVGFHKTGTSSMGLWLSDVGYRVGSLYGVNDRRLIDALTVGDFAGAIKFASRFDALEDNPWPVLYQELDRAFPGSKFILHMRESSEWFSSVLAEFGGESTLMREFIYGAGYGDPENNRTRYIRRYEEHNSAVTEYFDDREDLLVVDLFRDPGVTGTIARFIGAEDYPDRLPKVNARHEQPRRRRLRAFAGGYTRMFGNERG